MSIFGRIVADAKPPVTMTTEGMPQNGIGNDMAAATHRFRFGNKENSFAEGAVDASPERQIFNTSERGESPEPADCIEPAAVHGESVHGMPVAGYEKGDRNAEAITTETQPGLPVAEQDDLSPATAPMAAEHDWPAGRDVEPGRAMPMRSDAEAGRAAFEPIREIATARQHTGTTAPVVAETGGEVASSEESTLAETSGPAKGGDAERKEPAAPAGRADTSNIVPDVSPLSGHAVLSGQKFPGEEGKPVFPARVESPLSKEPLPPSSGLHIDGFRSPRDESAKTGVTVSAGRASFEMSDSSVEAQASLSVGRSTPSKKVGWRQDRTQSDASPAGELPASPGIFSAKHPVSGERQSAVVHPVASGPVDDAARIPAKPVGSDKRMPAPNLEADGPHGEPDLHAAHVSRSVADARHPELFRTPAKVAAPAQGRSVSIATMPARFGENAAPKRASDAPPPRPGGEVHIGLVDVTIEATRPVAQPAAQPTTAVIDGRHYVRGL